MKEDFCMWSEVVRKGSLYCMFNLFGLEIILMYYDICILVIDEFFSAVEMDLL